MQLVLINCQLYLFISIKIQNVFVILKRKHFVWYYWNNSSWMQHSIFQSWIKQVNQQMRNQHRNILLLVDNVSSHHLEEDEVLSNIKLHFLPPNTTAHLQPIDQGIIHS